MTAQQRSARSRAIGGYGEHVAARHLTSAGMVLLDSNWRCDLGEIDLVLRDGDTLVVCEVKTRTTIAFGSPLEAVDEAKLDRLVLLGDRWCQERGLCPPEVRVDLVSVLRSRKGRAVVEHVMGVA